MAAHQEAIFEFRRNERVGSSTVYRCCECGHSNFHGLDMSPTDDGEEVCNDGKLCEQRQRDARSFEPEFVNGVDCDGRIYGR